MLILQINFFVLFHFSRTMVKFIPNIGCVSLQIRMLEIIFGYVDKPETHVQDLFAGLIEQSHWIFNDFNNFNHFNDRKKHSLMYRHLPNALNQKNKNVHSKIMKFLYFDGKTVTPYPVSVKKI